jgi:hypothetical protein
MNIVFRRLRAIILALVPHDGSSGKTHRWARALLWGLRS